MKYVCSQNLRKFLVSPFSLCIAGLLSATIALGSDWPGWSGPERDGIWHETGLIEKFPSGGPPVVWRAPLGTGYSGPAVANGRVYVMDRERDKGPDGKPLRATRSGMPGTDRIVCRNAADGETIWRYDYPSLYKVSYPSGPRTTPLVDAGKVYALGTMGELHCLDAAKGKVIWSKNLAKAYKTDPPIWGYSASPLIEGDLLYTLAGGEGSAVVALNKNTGAEVWHALTSEEVCYSPPIVIEAGGKKQLIVWLSEGISGLDPATGKVFWTQAYPAKGKPYRPAVNIATVRRAGDLLFLSNAYHGPMMLKLASDKPAATLLWDFPNANPEKPTYLSILMPSPVFKDSHVYGVSMDGELRCLDAHTGKLLWETYAATGGKKTDCGTAFLIPQGDRYVIFNDQGDLILADLNPRGYHEIDRAHIIDPMPNPRGRTVVWSHPAFAQRCVFARNDKEMVCVSLAAPAKVQ
jgi:outer membrane protein assembly factor BamB